MKPPQFLVVSLACALCACHQPVFGGDLKLTETADTIRISQRDKTVLEYVKTARPVAVRPGREKSVLRRHPWIFSGAVQHVEGDPAPGGTVDLFSHDKQFLARASYSPTSQIRARVWTFEDKPVDKEFFRKRIRRVR